MAPYTPLVTRPPPCKACELAPPPFAKPPTYGMPMPGFGGAPGGRGGREPGAPRRLGTLRPSKTRARSQTAHPPHGPPLCWPQLPPFSQKLSPLPNWCCDRHSSKYQPLASKMFVCTSSLDTLQGLSTGFDANTSRCPNRVSFADVITQHIHTPAYPTTPLHALRESPSRAPTQHPGSGQTAQALGNP